MSDSPGPAPADIDASPLPTLTNAGRVVMLATAFLGWLCAGFLLSITSVAMQPAAVDLLHRTGELDRDSYRELSARQKSARKSQSSDEAPRPESAKSVANVEKTTPFPKPQGVPPDGDADHPPLTDAEQTQLTGWNVRVGQWVSWLKCAFLFGAALGGLCFGTLGDRFGRTKGMGLAIVTYSVMAGAAYFAQRPLVLWLCWFTACMGVGGMWPNGVALVSEAWSSLSRTMSAGIIGAAANIGIFLMSTLMTVVHTNPDQWRWVMAVAAVPIVLGVFSLFAVPESPLWLAARRKTAERRSSGVRTGEIFRPPLLWITLVGIALATVPIVGGWGSADWMVQWADRAGGTNPALKAQVNQARAMTGIIGSFLGGWIASLAGRRLTYFLVSLTELAIAQYTFWCVVPTDPFFLWWVSALGLFSGIYFGWLPFCLPELFPTRARSAGAGVSFNFGRILTAVTVFATGALMSYFQGDYARIGRVTSLIFALGMVVIWFAPDTSRKTLDD